MTTTEIKLSKKKVELVEFPQFEWKPSQKSEDFEVKAKFFAHYGEVNIKFLKKQLKNLIGDQLNSEELDIVLKFFITDWDTIRAEKEHKEHLTWLNQLAKKRKWKSAELKSFIWDKSNGICIYCGGKLHPFSDFSIDHFIPYSKKGSDNIDNLFPCCLSCNLIKGNRPLTTLKDRLELRCFWYEENSLRVPELPKELI